jgi:mono/diheme cytochrome c family protein
VLRALLSAAAVGIASVILASCTGGAEEPGRESQPGTAPDIMLGAKLYAQSCQSCHGDLAGNGNDGVAPLHNHLGHTFHHPDAQLVDTILLGKPSGMPGFAGALSEDDARAILDFIKTSWTESDRATQTDISERYQAALDGQ